jgi:hypothetical protein
LFNGRLGFGFINGSRVIAYGLIVPEQRLEADLFLRVFRRRVLRG